MNTQNIRDTGAENMPVEFKANYPSAASRPNIFSGRS